MRTNTRLNFYVNHVRDADLIAFLKSLPNRSEFIREALYEKMAHLETSEDPPASQPPLDLEQIGDIVRQAVRDELTVARLTFGLASTTVPDPDEERRKEQERKLATLFNTWDDEDEEEENV